MSDPDKSIPLTFGMAERLQAAKRQAEERNRLISYQAARGIKKLEQYLAEEAQR
ncbi:hypothetical protein ACFPJ1_40505 [Kribbella qitaiheensis]|uniref:hypothetical protein n=1 Tax=Kribbella qitaiheensis TaxID=1544730 RepID=UPI0036115CBF